jgi:flavin reductase (DIM6/NTAB) family NADH-FMN oxidoreductase RutF
MSKTVWKGGTLTAPVPPAMVSLGDMEKPNIITIAWTGIINSDPPKTYISVRPERYSYEILKDKREFVINLPPAELARAVDFCGVKSGRVHDKFKLMKLTANRASSVAAPLIEECPVNLECKVTDIMPLGSHTMFIADIAAVSISSKYIDENGKLRIDKCGLLAYAHGEYFRLGESLGKFGFSVKKKK